jgi:CDP-paratose 2-epimerase
LNYLITGGCGFLGSNIAARLIMTGQRVAIADNLSRHGSTANLEWLRSLGPIEFYHADVRKRDDVDAIVSRLVPDAVFHLAGQVAMTTSLQNPRLDFDVNSLGSLNVLEAVRTFCPEAAVIYSSTNKVYGDLERYAVTELDTRYVLDDFPEGLPESVPLDFSSPYGCSKGAADQYMLDYARVYGLNTVVFRHSSMYGGRQFSTVDQGWIGWFCEQALNQAAGSTQSFSISGNGKQVRDILHAEDMVALYLLAAEHISSIRGEVFNIGGGHGNSLSILELLALLEQQVDTRLTWHHIAVRQSDQKVFVADLAKICARLPWTPTCDKATGIASMVAWVRSMRAGSARAR